MHIWNLFYNLSLFLTLCAVVSFSFYLHQRGAKFWLGKAHMHSTFLNTLKKTIRQIHYIGMCNRFSCITLNFCPWPFETLRSITVTAESTHSSDSLKHGFRSHGMLTTGQKKKLHCQWDLHRLVRGKTTDSGRQTFHLPSLVSFSSRPNYIYTKVAANLCGSESKHQSCSWTGA